jgi:hypothetical protein
VHLLVNYYRLKTVLLKNSHGRLTGTMLQENLGKECDVTRIFKPNSPLENVAKDIRWLGKPYTVKVGGFRKHPGQKLTN